MFYSVKDIEKELSSFSVVIVLTDTFFAPLQSHDFWPTDSASRWIPIYLPGGETIKSPRILCNLLMEVSEICTRDTHLSLSPNSVAVLSIGGGTISDLGALLAHLLFRGVAHYIVPTTLLAMVDAAVGGKSAINGGSLSKQKIVVKNLFGAISQPRGVFYRSSFLKTLEVSEFTNGLAEFLKHALLHSNQEFARVVHCVRIMHKQAIVQKKSTEAGYKAPACNFVQTALQEKFTLHTFEQVISSARFKEWIVQESLRDRSNHCLRDILNLGHTLGHAIESLLSLPHGVAVMHGVALEALIMDQLLQDNSWQQDSKKSYFPWLSDWIYLIRTLYGNAFDITCRLEKTCKAPGKFLSLLGCDKKNQHQSLVFSCRGKKGVVDVHGSKEISLGQASSASLCDYSMPVAISHIIDLLVSVLPSYQAVLLDKGNVDVDS